MRPQIFVIHGGDAFDTYEEYLANLRAKTTTLERLSARGWKLSLRDRLADIADVYTPEMPNKQNAKYAEWKIWFGKIVPLMNDGVVLVGHSLGGIFLAKYLSEEILPTKIRATLLVAPPFNTATNHPLADFNLGEELHKLQDRGGEIVFYHSRDDQVVPYSNLEDYRRALPLARYVSFENRGHFNQESFLEIEEDLRKLLTF